MSNLNQLQEMLLAQEQQKLIKMAADPDWATRALAAKSPNIPVELLKKLASEEHSMVRFATTQNPNLPKECFEKLATDDEWMIRLAVAGSPEISKIPLKFALQLAEDKVLTVRCALAINHHTPSEALDKLGSNPNEDLTVKKKLAQNPSISLNLLMQFLEDKNLVIAEAAYNNILRTPNSNNC